MPYLKEKVFYVQYISTIKKDCINKFRVIFGVILSSVLTFSYRKVFAVSHIASFPQNLYDIADSIIWLEWSLVDAFTDNLWFTESSIWLYKAFLKGLDQSQPGDLVFDRVK